MRRHSRFFILMPFLVGFTWSALATDATELKVSTQMEPEGVTITMVVEGIPLKDVLKVLSEQTGFSYVANEAIENKKISLSLDNVPIRDALASIASANDLRFEQRRGSKVILFYPSGTGAATAEVTETRIFRLKYTRLSTSPLDVGGGATISGLATAASLSGGGGSSSSSSGPVADKGIDRVIASLLTPGGRVTLDLHTNSLIVTDTLENLERLEAVIQELDRPSPQVAIEVYLVEVKKNILTDHGIDWGGTNGALGALTGGSRTTGFPFTETFLNQQQQGIKATTQGTSTLTLGTLSAANFTATLRLITSDSQTKILARPRLLTLNNEAANIKLVTNTAIADTSSTVTAEGTAVTSSHTAERAEVGIVLKMTPQINEDNSVALFVEPSITTVAASSFFPTTFQDPTTRTVRTMARIKNNETLVIGGLLDRSDDTTNKKIPLLGDIPILGYAFKYRKGNDLNRELLIFITPHIVSGYGNWQSGEMGFTTQRDPSMEKVLDEFLDEEIRRQMDALQGAYDKSKVVRLEEKKLSASKNSHAASSLPLGLKQDAAAEMARTLETVSRKK